MCKYKQNEKVDLTIERVKSDWKDNAIYNLMPVILKMETK